MLQSMGSQKAGHDWVTEQQPFILTDIYHFPRYPLAVLFSHFICISVYFLRRLSLCKAAFFISIISLLSFML